MDRQTDRQMEKLIWCGLGNLLGSFRFRPGFRPFVADIVFAYVRAPPYAYNDLLSL